MADIQALIDSGLSPEDAALLAADLQRYETAGAPQLSFGIGGLGPASVDQNTYGFKSLSAPLSNKGNPTATYGNISNTIAVGPEQAVRLVDAGGNVIFSGTGIEAANKAVELAQGLSDELGNKAAWEIQTGPSGIAGTSAEPWSTIAQENRNASVLGKIADVALPVIGGMINPFLGAALGSALSSVAQGRGLGNTLLRAAIAGGTSAIGDKLSGGIGSLTNTAGSTAGSQVGSTVASNLASNVARDAVDDIVVNAIINRGLSPVATSLLSSAAGSALGSAASSLAKAPQVSETYTPPPENIILTAPPTAGIGIETIAPLAIGTGTAGGLLASAGGSGAGSSASSATGSGTGPTPDEIVVTARTPATTITPPVLPDIGPLDVSTDITNTVKDVQVPSVRKPLTVLDYARLGMNASNVLGAIAGGGGGGGALGPDNSAISYTPLNRQQMTRTPSGAGLGAYGFDPFTYGQASGNQPGEYLFFQPAATTPVAVVPSGAVGLAEGGDVDDDMVKHLMEYRKGGGHNGPGKVKGIGSGQEDKIPAWLSDGEYVWSAQDVADLGDGSTDEGVRRLDKMRQMVRHRAGRKDVKKIAKPQKGIESLLAAVGGK
jgi:hypothetical protein